MLRRPSHALIAAALSAVAATLVYVAAFGPATGRWLDGAGLDGFIALRTPFTQPIAWTVAHAADPAPFVLLGAALCAIALARGRPRVALMIPVVLAAANVTTQVLKPALADPRPWAFLAGDHIPPASWPSGHATASMSLALCAIVAVGPRARPWVAAVGAVFAVAVSYALLALAWHFPSDILGGYLVAATWTLLGVAALRSADARFRAGAGRERAAGVARAGRETRRALIPAAVVACAALVAAAALALARPHAVATFASEHTVALAGVAAIGMFGLALAAGLAVALRR